MKRKKEIFVIEPASLESRIFLIRGQKVMIDSDLAVIYGVQTKILLQSVKRNKIRFPLDFCFQLNIIETQNLRSQFVTSSSDYGGRRYLPYVFTEHGVTMLSSVLRSKRAVQMNIFIVRAFIRLRELLVSNKELAHEVAELQYVQEKQGEKIEEINDAVLRLIGAQIEPKDPIGFRGD